VERPKAFDKEGEFYGLAERCATRVKESDWRLGILWETLRTQRVRVGRSRSRSQSRSRTKEDRGSYRLKDESTGLQTNIIQAPPRSHDLTTDKAESGQLKTNWA
jgi:hypothetical protein